MIEEVMKGEATLLDVRSEGEWVTGHAEGALHMTVGELMQGGTVSLDKTKSVYLYCASGARADRAARYLREQGYDAENIGGLSDWLSHGGTLAA